MAGRRQFLKEVIFVVRGIDSVTVFSQNAKKLAAFYKNVVGLKQTMEAEMGDKGEELYGFEFGKGSGFYVIDHSKVKGKNKEPERSIINFEVDTIEKEVARVKKAGAKLVRDIYHVENYGHIATFEDSDGNFFQLVQVRGN